MILIQGAVASWMRLMITYGFKENKDYIIVSLVKNDRRSKGGQNKQDYIITVEMAEKIGMIQRTPKGEEVREYFVQCANKLKGLYEKPMTLLEAQRQLHEEVGAHLATLETNEPKVAFAEAVTKTEGSIPVGTFAKRKPWET